MYQPKKNKELVSSDLPKRKGVALQKKSKITGLPDTLKSGIEQMSGHSMDDVKVHYNSSKPTQLQAHAYAQGSDIHLAPNQEKHLPHEAWHVVQQKQGRVKPTMQLQGMIDINDDTRLEKEADLMGERALNSQNLAVDSDSLSNKSIAQRVVQRKIIARITTVKESNELPRIISELRLEGRAPTDTEGSNQGDHTVAETLINESVQQEVMGMPRKIALNNIMVLAKLTLPKEGIEELSKIVETYWESFDSLEGEDQNTILQEMIQRYIELANKRPGTAFLRNKEVTNGGGSERQAIGLVRGLATKIKNGEEINSSDLQVAAQSVIDLIDIRFVSGEEERYVTIIARALQHSILSVLYGLSKEDSLEIVHDVVTGLGQRDDFNMNFAKDLYNELIKRLGLE